MSRSRSKADFRRNGLAMAKSYRPLATAPAARCGKSDRKAQRSFTHSSMKAASTSRTGQKVGQL